MAKVIGLTIDRELGIFTSEGESRREPSYIEWLLSFDKETLLVVDCFHDAIANLLNLIQLTNKELEHLADQREVWSSPDKIRYGQRYFKVSRYIGGMWTSKRMWGMEEYERSFKAPLLDRTPEALLARAKEVGKIGQLIYDTLDKVGIKAITLSSPAYAYKPYMAKLPLPDITKIPADAQNLAQECLHHGLVSAYSIGTYKRAYDWDIVAAYPAEAAKLLHLDRGTWQHSAEYLPQAQYGFARCEVNIDSDISPVITRINLGAGSDRNYTPRGLFEATLTKGEIDFINNRELGFVTPFDGWWWTPDPTKSKYHPLSGPVNFFFQKREETGGIEREVFKKLLAGAFYGLFGEDHREEEAEGTIGELWNPIYTAIIESEVTLKVIAFCLDHGVKPLHIATDGVLLDKDIKLESSSELGGWKLSHVGPAIIAGSANKAIAGRTPDGPFGLTYEWLEKQIEDNPEAEEYTLSGPHILKLGEAIAQHRLKDLGKIIPREATFRMPTLEKLEYTRLPKTGGDLLKRKYHGNLWDIRMLNRLAELNEPGEAYNDQEEA